MIEIPGMIEAVPAKAGEEINFQEGSIADIPFEKKHASMFVLCSFMIFHMSEETRRKGISEVFRVLKPGGRRWLILDLASPPTVVLAGISEVFRVQPIQRSIAHGFDGGFGGCSS